MVDLNEMNKRASSLSGRDGRVAVLAENLFKRGLAMTMSSARSLAETMVDTESKVQRQYEDRKADFTRPSETPMRPQRDVPLTSGFGHKTEQAPIERPAPPRTHVETEHATPENKYLRENIEEIKRRAVEGVKVEVHADYETPRHADNHSPKGVYIPPPSKDEYVELKPEMTVAEAFAAAERADAQGSERREPTTEEFVTLPVQHEPEAAVHEGYVSIPVPETVEAVPEKSEPLLDDEAYVVMKGDAHHEEEPGDEDVSDDAGRAVTLAPAERETAHDESEVEAEPLAVALQEAAEPAPTPAPEPERPKREDMAKKHGIDLSSIFNVNK